MEETKIVEKKQDAGLRFNNGKIRYDLLEPYAIEELAKVFTKGANKYEDNNWLRGMRWSKMRASLARHLAAWDKGEDFDFDPNCEGCKAGGCVNHTGLPHMAHAAWNALGLVSYMKHYPQGDDRFILHKPKFRIGLDIDDVICQWINVWCEKFNKPLPSSWNFQWDLTDVFADMSISSDLDDFYLGLPAKINPEEMKFEPVCYISHRPVSDTITKQWLSEKGFPLKPVFHVQDRFDKLRIAKEQKLDIFVDDNIETFNLMNENDICCYLMDAKHNEWYNVGYRRIKSLNELPV